MEKTTKIMANSTGSISTMAKNNKEIINEVRKLKESKNQIVTQNIINNNHHNDNKTANKNDKNNDKNNKNTKLKKAIESISNHNKELS